MREVSLSEAQAGDVTTRMLSGIVPMQLVITKIHEGMIFCGDWTFDQETGVEEDPELGWGIQFGITGSYIVKVERKENDDDRTRK